MIDIFPRKAGVPTPRVALREWREADAASLFALAKVPVVGESAGFPPHQDEAESLRVIREVFCKPESYAIVAADDGGLLGCINLYPGSKGESVYESEEVKLGYWLGLPFWGCERIVLGRQMSQIAILKFERSVARSSAMPAAFLCRQCMPASLHLAATRVLHADSIMPEPM